MEGPMVHKLLAMCAFLSYATAVFAETGAIPIPPIWSIMFLVIVTAFVWAAVVGVRELDNVGKTTKNFLTGLLFVLWVFVVYYFS